MTDDKKPRTVEAALETKEFVAWKNSGKATRESCPLNIVADEKVLMIEHSAYDALAKENEELMAEIEKKKCEHVLVAKNYGDYWLCERCRGKFIPSGWKEWKEAGE